MTWDRWSAPEVISRRKFSKFSDVWSYAVTVWEVFTLCEVPYKFLSSNAEVAMFVEKGGRLDRPQNCSAVVWEILESCWVTEIKKRPSFETIITKLESLLSTDFAILYVNL
jgi:serine/threonine protein kinase